MEPSQPASDNTKKENKAWFERNAAVIALLGVIIAPLITGLVTSRLNNKQIVIARETDYSNRLRSAYESFYSNLEESMNVNAGSTSGWQDTYRSHFAAKGALNKIYLYSSRTDFTPEYCMLSGAKKVLAALRLKHAGVTPPPNYADIFNQSTQFECLGASESVITTVSNEFLKSMTLARKELGLPSLSEASQVFLSEMSFSSPKVIGSNQ